MSEVVAPQNHRALVFAGPNGSGKSTLIAQIRQDPAHNFPERYINADDMARTLPANLDEDSRARQAFNQARALRREYREAGVSFAFETVFSHPSGLIDLMQLKSAGYQVAFFFVTTGSPNLNVERVRQRVLSGGHDVPEDKIRARYERSLRFLVRAAEIADQTYLFDNGETLQLAGVVTRNQLFPGEFPLPEYLQSAFAAPFAERRVIPLPRTSLDLPVSRPDEQAGVSIGVITSVNRHYALQQTLTPSGAGLLLHDRLLLTENMTEGEQVQITYRDGYGTIAHRKNSA